MIPVGAISVHGVNGMWGVLAVGLFANGKYGAGWNGVVRDRIHAASTGPMVSVVYSTVTRRSYWPRLDAAVVLVFGFAMAYVWFKVSNLITPIRVSKETEMQGLDAPEMGALGYPDFTVASRN